MSSVEHLPSKLFDLQSLPTIDSNQAKIHIPWSYKAYKPESTQQLQDLYPQIRLQESAFPNGMWLLLAGEAPSVVMPWLMNGDNLADALLDIYNAHAFTQNREGIGPNVKKLSVLSVFGDWRQDNPSKKNLPQKNEDFHKEDKNQEVEEMALVIAQSSWSQAVASLMKDVAKVDNLITIDGHSFTAKDHFEAKKIEVVNITTAKLIVEAIRNKDLLKDDLPTMIAGVDFGNLALAHKLSQEEEFELGILRKRRIPTGNGNTSTTQHELVHGDVQGRRVILIDDLIGSGGTILHTVELLLKQGAKEIIVCAAHAVFAGGEYYAQLQKVLKYDQVKLVMVSDTIPLKRLTRGSDRDLPYTQVSSNQEKSERKQVTMLSVDDFIAYTVGVMLSSKDTEEISAKMKEHVLPQPDPYELYHQITGKKISKPAVTAIYREGHFEPIQKD